MDAIFFLVPGDGVGDAILDNYSGKDGPGADQVPEPEDAPIPRGGLELPETATGSGIEAVNPAISSADQDTAVIDGGRGKYPAGGRKAPDILASGAVNAMDRSVGGSEPDAAASRDGRGADEIGCEPWPFGGWLVVGGWRAGRLPAPKDVRGRSDSNGAEAAAPGIVAVGRPVFRRNGKRGGFRGVGACEAPPPIPYLSS